jgi:methionyl-tRNA synthetase
MLLSAGLPLPKTILTHGFITSGGHKMSKSIGNVIDPFAVVEKYGVDPVRYYLLREIPTQDDGDFSDGRFAELYTAELANSLGNTASRVAKMAANIGFSQSNLYPPQWLPEVKAALGETLDIRAGIIAVLGRVVELEKRIAVEKPWTLAAEGSAELIAQYIAILQTVAWNLQPYLPETAEKLLRHFSAEKIEPLTPLFPRLK